VRGQASRVAYLPDSFHEVRISYARSAQLIRNSGSGITPDSQIAIKPRMASEGVCGRVKWLRSLY